MRSGLRSALAGARQLLYPREYRISAPARISEMLSQLAEALRNPQGALDRTEVRNGTGDLSQEMAHMLADVGTSLWRLRVRLLQLETSTPSDEMKRTLRHFHAAWEALHDGGLEVIDHTGDVIPEAGHYGLRMVSFQPTEGISRQTVIETLKPTVRFRQKVIQIGEVIVGTPGGAEED